MFTMAQAPAGVEMVDLGLPSGLKWANMNVGATTEEDFGLYFAWGETVGYTNNTNDGHSFNWSNYNYCNGTSDSMTKYCTISSNYGTVDNKTILEPEDDAAHVNWGDNWRMPTDVEWLELCTNCTWTWTTVNDIYGCNVIGPNGNRIFLPAAGYRTGSVLRDASGWSAYGYYWSSSLHTSYSWGAYVSNPDQAWRYYFSRSGNGNVSISNRYMGQSVRAVYGESTPEPENPEDAVDNTPVGVEMVDLNLPSGLKWANMNLGATTEEGYGYYFAWGETVGYTSDINDGRVFEWEDYQLCNGTSNSMTKYCHNSSYGTIDNKTTLTLEDDAAHVNWSGNWRMPTPVEWEELRANCTWIWTTVNGINGYRVSGSNGNSIFLPAAGFRYDAALKLVGSYGYYWTSSRDSYYGGYNISLGASDVYMDHLYRCNGQSVRAVYDGLIPEPEETVYTRSTTPGRYGTICLPKGVAHEDVEDCGAVFFNIVYAVTNTNGEITGILMEEEIGDLVAGKPYIFRATADELVLPYTGEAVANPLDANGLVGNLSETPLNVPQNMYVLSNNQIRKLAGGTATAGQNRAYIDLTNVTKLNYVPAAAPNRVMLNVEGSDVATDMENIKGEDVQKIIRDGQLLIIRDGKIYNVLGKTL